MASVNIPPAINKSPTRGVMETLSGKTIAKQIKVKALIMAVKDTKEITLLCLRV